MEVLGDFKLSNEFQLVFMELYFELFEGEEVVLKEKINDVIYGESNVVFDFQVFVVCSLSDICFMECDVIVEEKVVIKINELFGNNCENMFDNMNIVNIVQFGIVMF